MIRHSRNPESFRESGILMKTKKDSGQAGMTWMLNVALLMTSSVSAVEK
jgi:hypothetical protein